jgi:hypothetical protein
MASIGLWFGCVVVISAHSLFLCSCLISLSSVSPLPLALSCVSLSLARAQTVREWGASPRAFATLHRLIPSWSATDLRDYVDTHVRSHCGCDVIVIDGLTVDAGEGNLWRGGLGRGALWCSDFVLR